MAANTPLKANTALCTPLLAMSAIILTSFVRSGTLFLCKQKGAPGLVKGILVPIVDGSESLMRTQSPDTSIEAERVLTEMIRNASMCKRFRPIQAMTQRTFWANIHAWQENHPEASEKDAAFHFVALLYGDRYAEQVKASMVMDDVWHLQPVDIARLLHELGVIFDEANVPWYLGGSIASSLHGMQQLARDIDVIVDLSPHSLASLYPLLARSFVVDEKDFQDAALQQTSIALLHRTSLMKIDLIQPGLLFGDSFCTAPAFHVLDERYKAVCIASAVEMILFKLQRYQHDLLARTDGMQDDAEWNDILGMLKVQGPLLDLPFLEQWSRRLHMLDMWRTACKDAGLNID